MRAAWGVGMRDLGEGRRRDKMPRAIIRIRTSHPRHAFQQSDGEPEALSTGRTGGIANAAVWMDV